MALQCTRALAPSVFEKFREMGANDSLKGGSHQIREAAVGGAYFSVQCDRDQNVVEGVNEVAISLLRPLDYGKELVHLAIAGRSGDSLFNTADQTAQLGNFLVSPPGIDDKNRDHRQESGKKELIAPGESANRLP